MRRRLGIHGADDEAIELMALLAGSPRVELVRVFTPDAQAAVAAAERHSPELTDLLLLVATDDFESFVAGDDLSVVVDASGDADFVRRAPDAARRGVQIVSPRAARLLWGYRATDPDRRTELLDVLGELGTGSDWSVDPDELFTRMLEIALDVTGADGGSLMTVERSGPTSDETLRIRVAAGVEPELWSKIRVPVGQGIAGRAAAERRALCVDGPADEDRFDLVHERLDVASAISAPLYDERGLLGVLNVHHSRQRGAFGDDDVAFLEQLAALDATIVRRAEEQAVLRDQAARYAAVREVNALLGEPGPRPVRLAALCRHLARGARTPGAVARVLLCDEDEPLQPVASSLSETGRHPGPPLPIGAGVEGRVAATGDAIHLAPANTEREGPALLALPLRGEARTLGVLTFETPDAATLDAPTRGRLTEIASAMARALEQADREQRMAERATRMSAINETGIRMLAASELGEVASLATSSCAMVLGAEHAVLRLRDDDTSPLAVRSYFGPADREAKAALFGLDDALSRLIEVERTPVLVPELSEHDRLAPLAASLRSVVAVPLVHDGHCIGSLAVYDKVEGDRFFSGSFDEDDLEGLLRFAPYVERAVASARDRVRARRQREFDPETGLPTDGVLERRTHEEIARTAGRDAGLALCICHLEDLEGLRAHDPARARRLVRTLADALRRHTRDFDVVGRRDDAAFEVLLPEPGPSPGDRIYGLARAVADELAKEDAAEDAGPERERVSLGFGYAIHPYDGADRDALVATASTPRIRMV